MTNADRPLRPRAAWTVARFEVRRTLRNLTDSVAQTAILAIVGLVVFVPAGVGATYLAYRLGGELRDGSGSVGPFAVESLFRGGVGVAFLGLVVLSAFRTAAGRAELDQPEFLLASLPVPTVVAGTLLAEWIRLALWVALPLAAVAGALSVGALSPLAGVSLILAVLAVLCAAYPVGFAIGIAIRHAATTIEPLARHKLALGAVAMLAYVGFLLSGWFERSISVAFDVLQDSPAGWIGDLGLVGLPGDHGSPLLAAGGLAVALACFGAGAAATTIVADRNWFADPPRPDDEAVRPATPERSRLEAVLGRVVAPAPATVATTVVKRARRKPIKLAFAAYPLFFAIPVVQTIVEQGTVPGYAVVLAALYVTWSAGALVTLNPIGDLGPALPTTLLSGMSGRSFVGGHLLVAIPVGVALGVVVTGAAAIASPLDPTTAAIAVVGAAFAGAWAPLVAVGFGSMAPRFGSVSVTRNTSATIPSKTAFASYSAVIVLAVASAAIVYEPDVADLVATVVTLLGSALPGPDATVRSEWVHGLAVVVLGLAVVAPLLSYRYATRLFDRYTV